MAHIRRYKVDGALALWLVLVAVSSLWIAYNGRMDSGLSIFLPHATTSKQHVLLEQLKSGLQTRLILVGLHGHDSAALAGMSRGLRANLSQSALFQAVYNGTRGREFDKLTWRRLEPTLLFRYRYLLDPATKSTHFSVKHLHAMLQEALARLASPADVFMQALLPADPGGAYPSLLKKLVPARAPQHAHGVWFSADGKTALLVTETTASGYSLAEQSKVIGRIRTAFAALPKSGKAKLWLAGPAVFAVAASTKIRQEATLFSLLASAAVVLFLVVVLRSLRAVVLGIVPLATGVLAGVAIVIGAFGSIHGITLAFGVTLLGVAIDYPLHFFVHRDPRFTAEQTMRSIRSTLFLGVATTAIGYLAMLFSGIKGLAELALFAICGLVSAAATTYWVLPTLARGWTTHFPRHMGSKWRLPQRRLFAALVYVLAVAASIYLVATSSPIWQSNLAKLSPLPPAQLHLDRVLRHAFNAPDVNRLIAVTAASEEGALERLERLGPYLRRLKRRGAVAGYYLLTDVFPSRASQRLRQAAIPPPAKMRRRFKRALTGLPFKAGVFQPYLADLARSRTLPVLDRARLKNSALGLRVQAELKRIGNRWQAIVPLRRVQKPRQIRAVLAHSGLTSIYYIDIKRATSRMLARYRKNAIHLFLIGSALTVLLLLVTLKSFTRTVRVLVPAYSAALVTAAIFVAAGISLTLFHLVSLLLVIGLGLDYALFFNRTAATQADRWRTVRGIVICNVSTVLVFGLLALAATPVLQAIGSTVALGSVLSLIFAGLLAPLTIDETSTA